MAQTSTTQMVRGARVVEINLRFPIDATPAAVWKALTEDVSAWWGAPYLVLGERATRLVLERKIGGRFYEAAGTSDSVLWGTVTRLERNRCLQITGAIGSAHAIHAVVGFWIEPGAKGKPTDLVLEHRMAGQVTAQTRSGYTRGWKDLLGVRLKALAEEGTRLGLKSRKPRGKTTARRKTVRRTR